MFWFFFFEGYVDHRYQHDLNPSFPTRRPSDLTQDRLAQRAAEREATPRGRDRKLQHTDLQRNDGDGPAVVVGKHYRERREDAVVETLRLKEGKSEEHTSELQSLMRISYAVFCLKKKKNKTQQQQ